MTAPAAPRDRLLERLLVALSVAAALVFAVFAALRVPYPFELEWMEGAMVDHAARVRDGLAVYCEPGADHVAFLYTPLLYWLGAAVATVTGDGFLPLRLVSTLATCACAILLWHWVRRETGSVSAGVVAAGLFFAGYGYLRTWYDLARNDTLMLALVLATAMLLRFSAGWRGALLAAAAATLAFLGKQTALMWLPAIAVGAMLLDWRRGLVFAAAAAAGIAGAVLALDVASDGWFTFYVFEMPSGHGVQADRKLGFFTEDLVPLVPMVAGALWCCAVRWRDGRRGEALFLAAFSGGALLTSYLSRLHQGGYDNVLLYGFAAGCALLPMLLLGNRRVAMVLATLQFALLTVDVRSLWQPRPVLLAAGARWLPSAAHRENSEAMLTFLRSRPKEVWLPFHGHLATLAGKPRTAHAQAMFDLIQVLQDPERTAALSPERQRAMLAFHARVTEDLVQGRFAAVVLDRPYGNVFEGVFTAGLAGYTRRDAPVPDGPALQPVVGMVTHSPYVLAPP